MVLARQKGVADVEWALKRKSVQQKLNTNEEKQTKKQTTKPSQ